MIYIITALALFIGAWVGVAIGALVSHRSNAGKLKVTKDTDGTYCFLVLKQHPDELKDGDSIVLLVEKDTHK